MLPPLIQCSLRGLKYPRLDPALDLSNPEQFRSLIGWLENSKIRQYPAGGSERQQLTCHDAATFQAALQKYLTDLECPYEWSDGSNYLAVIQWVLGHAVGLEFDDQADELLPVVHRAVEGTMPAAEWSRRDLPPFPDVASPEVQEALCGWLADLKVEAEGEITPELLHRGLTTLETQILPALAWQAAHPGVTLAPSALLESIPLGFSTGDDKLDLAAKVVRMLYIKDLRALQTRADEAIAKMQELTANPRTDTSLGKIGR